MGGAANRGRAAAQAEDDAWPTKEAEAVANRRAITEAEVVANRRAIRGGAGGQPTGPRVEKAVGAQGHRAPYGVEEAMRARGGKESVSKEDRGQDKAAHGAATATKTHCKAHACGGARSPKCCRSHLERRPAKRPRGENGVEALPIFYWAPEV